MINIAVLWMVWVSLNKQTGQVVFWGEFVDDFLIGGY